MSYQKYKSHLKFHQKLGDFHSAFMRIDFIIIFSRFMSDFSTGLCDCFSDCGICMFTICCPCSQMSRNWADSRDQLCSACHCIALPNPMWTRDNIRIRLGQTQGHLCADYCLYYWCCPCAICQDARELKLMKTNTTSKNRRRKSEDENEL